MSELSELMAAINDSDRVTYMKPFPLPNESQTRALIAAMNRHRDEAASVCARAEEAEAKADYATSLYNTTLRLLHNERKRIAELEAELAAPRPYIVERAEAEVAKIVSSIREQESGK